MNYLKNAELNDSFIQCCNESYLNKLARKYNAYITDYNSYYKVIENFISSKPIFSSVKVIQLDRSAENGYPHTRPGIICIPSDARFPSLERTLYHEYIHIHQRRNFELWKRFLAKHGWSPIDTFAIPERWRERVRINPDTIYSQFWCFQNRYVPLPIYININNPRMDEIKVMFFDLETGVLEHEMPKSMDHYKKYRQIEHPFELYAVELEDKIKNDTDILEFIK